ncbi:MAG: hypothetical protein FWB85_08570 [Chitinispirillia bacterium]|nr:hypothetical protein [Chitinispirillia bacterium]MCL2242232.1 hypothetical protein [Chitinispirillia bacterium]
MANSNYRVIYTKIADDDQDKILWYFAKFLFSPEKGIRLVQRIRAEIGHCLSYMPQNYMPVDDGSLAVQSQIKMERWRLHRVITPEI